MTYSSVYIQINMSSKLVKWTILNDRDHRTVTLMDHCQLILRAYCLNLSFEIKRMYMVKIF